MSTTISIGDRRIVVSRREFVPDDEEIQTALSECPKAAVFCLCSPDHDLRLVSCRANNFRRASADDPHAPDCPFDLGLIVRPIRSARMFRPPAKKDGDVERRTDGTENVRRPRPARRTEDFRAFAVHLFFETNRATWALTQADQIGEYRLPVETDFIRAVQVALRNLPFASGVTAIETAASVGATFRCGICRFVPRADPSDENEMVDLLVSTIPLSAKEKVTVELWPVAKELLREATPKKRGQDGKTHERSGPFFIVAVTDATGAVIKLCLLSAGVYGGVFVPIASGVEGRMAEHLHALRRPAFRVTRMSDIVDLAEALGLPPDVATKLSHKPDFVCPRRGESTVFIEATSFAGFAVGSKHRKEALMRAAHYLAIGRGTLVVEFWDLSGPIPVHVTSIRSAEDLEILGLSGVQV